VERTGPMPALWPATRGKRRRLVQRPLPSMMMAIGREAGRVDRLRQPPVQFTGLHALQVVLMR